MKITNKFGDILDYSKDDLRSSIEKAFRMSENSVIDEVVDELTEQVTTKLKALKPITTDIVSSVVEEVLREGSYFGVFEQYRTHQQLKANLQASAGVRNVFNKYLDKSAWEINENANMSYSLQGLNHAIIRGVIEKHWLEKIYPEKVAMAYREGFIHIHDLDALSAYCCGWDLQDLLTRGFGGVPGKIYSGPPKHLSAALGQLVNFLFTLQGEIAGAVAVSNVDTYMAPFIARDKLSYKEVKQAVQEFIYNMNVPTRVGFQPPFSNVTLDLTIPKHLKNTPIIIGGLPQEETYGEFQAEADMFNKAFFEVMSEGDAHGRIFTFPIPTVNITKNFDWENPALNILWDVTAKYGTAYFANFINSDMDPSETRSMCCRLKLSLREIHKRHGGLFGSGSLTGSIGVVTLNLPMLAYEAKGSRDKFYTNIEKYLEIASRSLEIKRDVIEAFTTQGLYPYTKTYLESSYARDKKYWGSHFSTIGLIGMYEAAVALGIDYTSAEGRKFAETVLKFMNRKLVYFQNTTGNFYNLEATPAEGASYKLALAAKKKYPDIFTSGVATPYFTNSTTLPVGHSTDIFKILEHQDTLQTLYSGGTVLHAYLGEKITGDQSKLMVKKILSNYKIPYLSITPTFSVCPAHGYLAGEHSLCPKCTEEKDTLINRIAQLKEELK